MMTDNFANGVMIGLLIGLSIGGILGWFWNVYRLWIKDRDAARKPQMLMQPTAKTPSQVINAAARAEAKIRLVQLILFVVLPLILIEAFMPNVADIINGVVADVWRMLFG